MPTLEIESLERLTDWLDKPVPPSSWITVTQERVNQFAQASGDDQWIHVDTDRAAKESPFGITVAHGVN